MLRYVTKTETPKLDEVLEDETIEDMEDGNINIDDDEENLDVTQNQSALNMTNNESDGGGASESKRETGNKDEEEKMDGVKEYLISGDVDR